VGPASATDGQPVIDVRSLLEWLAEMVRAVVVALDPGED
jgi:hypothetical protein